MCTHAQKHIYKWITLIYALLSLLVLCSFVRAHNDITPGLLPYTAQQPSSENPACFSMWDLHNVLPLTRLRQRESERERRKTLFSPAWLTLFIVTTVTQLNSCSAETKSSLSSFSVVVVSKRLTLKKMALCHLRFYFLFYFSAWTWYWSDLMTCS